MEVLANSMVIIILQYISNQGIVYLKPIQCYISLYLNNNNKKNRPGTYQNSNIC